MFHRQIGDFFNFIGGTTRWLWGTFWRSIAGQKKYKFKEYIHGPENPEPGQEYHGTNNFLIGLGVFVIVIVPVLKKILG